MECTGERFIPEVNGDWTLEHLHRYRITCEVVKNKVVLDLACGDGYGSSMLVEYASKVIGIDIAFEAVANAVKKYSHKNLSILQATAVELPIADNSVDVIVSFETIEHLNEHEFMIQEIKRVLNNDGVLIISSPDKYEYSDKTGYKNSYHVNELYRSEFEALIQSYFRNVNYLGQRITFGSIIAAEYSSSFVSWEKDQISQSCKGLTSPEYILAIASDSSLPLLPSSVLKSPFDESDRVRTLQEHLRGSWEKIQSSIAWEKEAREYIALLEKKNDILQKTHQDIQKINFELNKNITEIYTSRSWCITAPLRTAAHLYRRMLNHNDDMDTHPPEILTSAIEDLPVWPPNVKALETTTSNSFFELIDYTPNIDIGVFLHIFYEQLTHDMVECLCHLPETSHIYISTDTLYKKNYINDIITHFGYSDRTNIRICPNQGWDIAPFLIDFSDVIPQYTLIVRLHSKRSPHIAGDVGETWRKQLFSSLIGNKQRVIKIIREFEINPRLGMISPPIIEHYADSIHFGGNFELMQRLLLPYDVHITPETPIDFPMGSMFWCRPDVLAPWLKPQFSYADFTPMADDERDSSLAHALERLFFFGCGISGFSWARLQADT